TWCPRVRDLRGGPGEVFCVRRRAQLIDRHAHGLAAAERAHQPEHEVPWLAALPAEDTGAANDRRAGRQRQAFEADLDPAVHPDWRYGIVLGVRAARPIEHIVARVGEQKERSLASHGEGDTERLEVRRFGLRR